MLACFLVVCRGLWKTVWRVVLGVHVDVHGEWVMLWVAAMYNVLAILSMTDVVCLACMQKRLSPWAVLGLYSMCGIWSVWYVGSLRYVVKLLLDMVDRDRWNTMEWTKLSVSLAAGKPHLGHNTWLDSHQTQHKFSSTIMTTTQLIEMSFLYRPGGEHKTMPN